MTCGICFHCRTGRAHMCERTRILGVDRDGGFADFAAIPASVVWRNDRSKLPPEIACLQEPFGNAVFATSTQDLAGRAVAVLGCGPVGLFTIAILRAFGAGRLLASDHVPFRLELARKLGAEDVVNVERGRRRARGGSPRRTRASAWASSRDVRERWRRSTTRSRSSGTAGTSCCSGSPRSRRPSTSRSPSIFKNLTVLGPVNGREIWEDVVHDTRWLLEHGVVDLRPLITAQLPLERFDEAFDLLESGNACKIVLRPNGVPA